MKKNIIEGIGSIYGGEYDEVSIEGIGKVKEDIKTELFTVEGLGKVKGRIEAKEIRIEGVSRIFKDIRAKKVEIEGVAKLRRAKLEAEHIVCDGVLACNREVSADLIEVNGMVSISELYGDQIKIETDPSAFSKSKLGVKSAAIISLYMGRKVDSSASLVDVVECTSLTASNLHAKIVRAHDVVLTNGCVIDKVICDGSFYCDDSCIIKKKEVK